MSTNMSWIKTWLCSKHLTQQKSQKIKKTMEIVENAHLHKPVLNKIMTTLE